MTSVPEQCLCCRHFRPVLPGYQCEAYSGYPGIPDAILEMQHDHRQPYKGDHGIRWEPKSQGTKHPMDETNEPEA